MRETAPLDPAFIGFGRSGSDETGAFWFETVRPGRVPFTEDRMQAPHISVMVFARGLLNHLATRLYFDDEPENATDPVLQLVPAERRGSMLAQRRAAQGDFAVYQFDIVLQGQRETVFLNL
jgi:protocatechuate 3,4-dioxygenase alpha subunit